jgi:hypothetical protein
VVNATFWSDADAEVRRHGHQTGLETPVVHAVNQECYEIVPALYIGFRSMS